ncbi:hypothetical protein [Streptomyces thermovulgaris]|uniref:hypothetical protein n=1 Tax=Streptomyces thermovulgaris TaxID=1934 RepID=UPI001FED0172|nr:hypothetical protein [Streptomyces thermovulgaris]
MREPEDVSRLREELRALGRSLDAPGSPGATGSGAAEAETMAERVLRQILADRVPVPVAEPAGAGEWLRAVRHWMRIRWRSLTAALCGLLTALALTPPVRAEVLGWFGFAGVEVRYDPSAVPSPGARVPGCGRSLSLEQARRQAGFAPLVPAELGVPDAVTVTGDPAGRLFVTLCWHEQGRTVRLDQYPQRLDPGFVKSVREPPEWVRLDTTVPADGLRNPALWFPRPHLLTFWLMDTDGHRFTRSGRTAGPTLLWMRETGGRDVTLRLEGVVSKERAVRIARSDVLEPGASGRSS